MEDTITLTLPTRWVVGLALFAGLILLSLVVGLILPRSNHVAPPLEAVQKRLGLDGMNAGVFLIFAVFWTLLFAVLFGGLFWLIWPVLWEAAPGSGNSEAVWNFRFMLVQITALTAVLGAVVTLPVTLNRLRLQREANRTADESLFNDKIAEAATDLHARRQRTMRGIDRSIDVWEDDIVRRNAAINRLEGLVEERMRDNVEEAAKRDVLARVSRLFGIYLRELSKDVRPKPTPLEKGFRELSEWARGLIPRSDMENAAQTIGRLRMHAGDLADSVVIDLEKANLQGCRLIGFDFSDAIFANADMQGSRLSGVSMTRAILRGCRMQGADFSEARIERSDLSGAQMQGASLRNSQMREAIFNWTQLQGVDFSNARMQRAELCQAQMQWTELWEAQMQGADLSGAQLQGANFFFTQLQGANLTEVQMDQSTHVIIASLRGAAFRSLNSLTTSLLKRHWSEAFADGTIEVPESERPAHWVREEVDLLNFDEEWHRVMREHFGMDPENPE